MVSIEQIQQFLLVTNNFGSGYGDSNNYNDIYNDSSDDGYGYDDGSGDGSGFGSGYGYDSGLGYGDDYSNYTYDDNYNDGYCDGSGDSPGSGSGCGTGSCSSRIYNDDIKEFNHQKVYIIDDTPTIISSIYGTYAKGYILKNDFTLEDTYIAKEGNCFAHGKTLTDAVRDAREKWEDRMPLEDKIEEFRTQFPTLDTTAPYQVFFDWHHKLTGSCRQGRQSFCDDHDITNMSEVCSVRRFIELTENAYGGDNIKQLKNSYETI